MFNYRNSVIISMTLISIIVTSVLGYNLSPKPNKVIREPKQFTNMPKVESSYFGFTLNLRPSGVIVGAPRAQSTLESQRKVNETGAIYKCTIATGTCSPFIFDDKGNINAEYNEYTYDSEKKDHQWLGASMDGGTKDTDKLIVCAPRLIANLQSDYLLNGICYWTPDTLSDSPMNVKTMAQLRLKDNQIKVIDGVKHFYHMFGEQGLSAHITSNNEEFLIGAPGIFTWKGSVIRVHPQNEDDSIGMSRRDLDSNRVVRQVQLKQTKYVKEIPDPSKWNQSPDSYFGYSVDSGYFDSTLPNKILYVASAPQANFQSGEVYIFDIVRAQSGDYHTIKKFQTFQGSQFGEYFGYAVLAEDLNGDGVTDLIVTAPQYSSDGYVEQGAIYVYINKKNFVFELQKIIKSPLEEGGRFGTTVSKLGDINRDGFNDIAVGAPFNGNGTVFIYLGGSKGLREAHSQQLSAAPMELSWGHQMFGHGLSKGSDIDKNGFNDLAIGAPNAEAVFVYLAYPVVKIHATVNSLSREIRRDQTKFKIKICYRISTTSPKIQSQDIAIRLSVDPQVKRVLLAQSNSAELTFNTTAVTDNQCRMLDADVKFRDADIFKPIELNLHYDLIKGIPDSEVFCETCATIDPAEPKVASEKITFVSGCKTDICVADLKLASSGLSSTFILGSSKTISVTYEITNTGETAYLPQINITSSNRMPFNKIPSSCTQYNDVLNCDLNRGQPILSGKQSITVVFDATQIDGKSITLTAIVSSTGQEQNPSDNIIRDYIAIQEFTEIEAIGKPTTSHINLEKVSNSAEIINSYEIKSSGPSKIQELEIAFEIPIAHKFYGASNPVPVVDVNNITIQGVYNSQLLYIDFYQNNTLLLVNPTEVSMSSTKTVIIQNGNQITYETSKSSSFDLEKNSKELYLGGAHGRHYSSDQLVPNNEQIRAIQMKSHELLSEELEGTLPINRTIVFSCIDPETTTCVRAVMKVNNFIPDTPVAVILKYHVDLNEVNKILIEPWEFFVIVTKLDIVKIGDSDGKSINVKRNIEYNVISKHQLYGTPWWVILLAILGGLLVLAAIAYGMHKAGFFRRTTKEEMDKLVQARREAADETEDEG